MRKLTRRRCCWSLVVLLVAAAAVGFAGFLLYEPEEQIGPANFHRLRAATTRDEAHTILGDPDRRDSNHVEPTGVEHVTEIDWTLETWGAEGTLYSAGKGTASEDPTGAVFPAGQGRSTGLMSSGETMAAWSAPSLLD